MTNLLPIGKEQMDTHKLIQKWMEDYTIDGHRNIVNIDTLFRVTNVEFMNLLKNLDLPITFDFSKRNNKKLYTHTFIKVLVEFLKIYKNNDFIFYSSAQKRDLFQTQLLKRVQSIFKIRIIEKNLFFTSYKFCLVERHAETISEVDSLFNNKKPPSFKKISKYLEKEGLTFLKEKYFQDISNKMYIHK